MDIQYMDTDPDTCTLMIMTDMIMDIDKGTDIDMSGCMDHDREHMSLEMAMDMDMYVPITEIPNMFLVK